MLNFDRFLSLPIKVKTFSLNDLCGSFIEAYYTGILDDIDDEYQTIYLTKAYKVCGNKVEWLETISLPIADIIDVSNGDEILKL